MIKYILVLILLVISGCSSSYDVNLETKIIKNLSLEPTNKNFISVLLTNLDGVEYYDSHEDVYVSDIILIKPNEFEILKNGTRFKELYSNLPNKDLYYVEFKSSSPLSLMTVIDLEEETVINIFGLFLSSLG
jgi:hypothetical protein